MHQLLRIIYFFSICLVLIITLLNCEDKSLDNNSSNQTPDPVDSISLVDSYLVFDFYNDTVSLQLTNDKEYPVTFSVLPGSDKFSILPYDSIIAQDDTIAVEMVLDRSLLPSDSIPTKFYAFVYSKGTLTDSIPVWAFNFVNDYWYLDLPIIDAKFCRETGKIVAMPENVNEIYVIDPVLQTIDTIVLPYIPFCFDVSPSGETAVVGYDHYLTQIDLASNTIIDTKPIGVKSHDIVITSNNWVYIFYAEYSTWIACIDLNNWSDTPLYNYVSTAKAKIKISLHPTENCIYDIVNGVLRKWGIFNDTTKFLYEYPRDGYAPGSPFWISEDGLRIMSSNGNMYRYSTIEDQDMHYNGRLDGELYKYNWITHSAINNRLYGLGASNYILGSPLHIFDYHDLAHLGSVEFPCILSDIEYEGGKVYPASGQYVFINKEGTELYILSRFLKDTRIESKYYLRHLDATGLP